MILDQLWKELDLSIREFVQFLCMMFGDDLDDAWEMLDEDGGGELDLEEWLGAVDKIGYFGPAKCVFSLLDSSDDGNISIDEFQVLNKYKKKKGDVTEDAKEVSKSQSRPETSGSTAPGTSAASFSRPSTGVLTEGSRPATSTGT